MSTSPPPMNTTMNIVAKPLDPPSWVDQLILAASTGFTSQVARLLTAHNEDPSLGDVNKCGWSMTVGIGSALHLAVRGAHTDIVVMLLQHPGVDVHAVDEMGLPPLWHAVMRSGPIMDLLLDAGADPSMTFQDKKGEPRTLAQRAVSDPNIMGISRRLSSTLRRTKTREVSPTFLIEAGNTASVLNVLSRRGLLLTSSESLSRLLGTAVRSAVNDRSLGAVAWLLDHGALLNGFPEQGLDLLALASTFRETAPMTFARIEQAILREPSSKETFAVALRRSRL